MKKNCMFLNIYFLVLVVVNIVRIHCVETGVVVVAQRQGVVMILAVLVVN